MGGMDLDFLTLSLGMIQEHELPRLILASRVAGLAELHGQFALPSMLGGGVASKSSMSPASTSLFVGVGD